MTSLNRSEEGPSQRLRYNNANTLSADELEVGIAHFGQHSSASFAHEIKDDVLHKGNLVQGPPRHFTSAVLHQMRSMLTLVTECWEFMGLIQYPLAYHDPQTLSPHRWLLGAGILSGCLLTASFNRVAQIHHPWSALPHPFPAPRSFRMIS